MWGRITDKDLSFSNVEIRPRRLIRCVEWVWVPATRMSVIYGILHTRVEEEKEKKKNSEPEVKHSTPKFKSKINNTSLIIG